MRTPLAERKLPDYSRREEWFNSISHMVGGGMGVIALVVCVVKAAIDHNIVGIATSAVYGASLILLYTMSSIYHGLREGMAKKVFQVLDHCAIYILIAGTYTPIALCAFVPENAVIGWLIFGIEWGMAALAITFNAIDLKRYAAFAMVCNLVMGWGIILVVRMALQVLTPGGFALILTGGILYTVGAIAYGLGRKKTVMHGVFHIFVLLGSLMHFLGIVLYVI